MEFINYTFLLFVQQILVCFETGSVRESQSVSRNWVPASCLDLDDAMALSNVVLLFFPTEKEIRRRVFPQILSSDILMGVKLHFSLGRPISAYCLFLGIWYFQINTHISNMGRGWNQNVRFETVAEITVLWDVTQWDLLSTLGPTCRVNSTPPSFGFITEFIPWWQRKWVPLKSQYISTRLHGITYQKTDIFSVMRYEVLQACDRCRMGLFIKV
jgi:hypothetical protein